jgi:DNA repair protein RecN (Recombination protein N)
MLTRLTIRNLVIVRELDLAFGAGMTALTGETGAGKSILIDALGLALGGKADAQLVRSGADKAEVSASFDIAPLATVGEWLEANDLDADGECLLRRVVASGGRSRAYVNGSPVPLKLLAELGERLVDIHGQHAHQSLMRPAAQRDLLDAYAGLQITVAGVAAHYREWTALRAQRDTLAAAAADRANRLDYLQFQIDELETLPLAPDAIDEIDREHNRLSHAERLVSDSAGVLAVLDESDPSLAQAVSRAAETIRALARYDTAIGEVAEMLDAAIQIDEAASALRHYQDRLEPDPDRLAELDGQLAKLHDAARKHQCQPAELADLLQRLRDEAEELADADNRLDGLDAELAAAGDAYRDAAQRLSKARAKAAGALSRTVTDSMQTLGMKGGRFQVRCEATPDSPAAHGLDRVAFDVSANPGQPPAPLAKVASGGELSRISLAIQVATAGCGAIPSLIFDEVDVGIGGATAEIVGQLLRRLGGELQVLCVTHLPQVAAQAHQQLRVHKLSDGKTTETRIDRLDAVARIDEIARMLGGVDITEQTRRHAEEMIHRAQKAS